MKKNAQVVRTSLRINSGMFEEFQDRVKELFGKVKGAQEIALNDAVKLWLNLSYGVGGYAKVYFGWLELEGFRGQRVLTVEELAEICEKVTNLSVSAIGGLVDPATIAKLFSMKPDCVVVIGNGRAQRLSLEGDELEVAKKLIDRLRSETAYLIWDEHKRVAEVCQNSIRILVDSHHYMLTKNLIEKYPSSS